MFRIELLPALHGDSIWIEYGEARAPYRILIDGGPLHTYDVLRARLEKVPKDERGFELMVLTHVDADHIESTVKLLNARELDFEVGDIWFNAWKHLLPSHKDELGPVQGEYVSALIRQHGLPWNKAFNHGPVAIPQGADPISITMPGGMRLTLLSPDTSRLAKLAPEWAKAVRAAGLEPGIAREALEDLSKRKKYRPPDELGGGRFDLTALAEVPFQSDRSPPNGSSIAFLAEYQGKSGLFLGDAHAPVVADPIKRLLAIRGEDKLAVDAIKLPHHGSRNNVSRELIELLKCPRYLISTNGDIFEHPDAESVARVIKHGGRLPGIYFNYLSDTTRIWKEAAMQGRTDFKVYFPEPDGMGIIIDL
jgi:beta-lactamase superfamily II metal-dependent hydrolase